MVIFHGYVKEPNGIYIYIYVYIVSKELVVLSFYFGSNILYTNSKTNSNMVKQTIINHCQSVLVLSINCWLFDPLYTHKVPEKSYHESQFFVH